jgi:UDP-3-O-[3-hydroxymyristoyl] glucosamine N-acyltransferase
LKEKASFAVGELAGRLGGTVLGDGSVRVRGLASLKDAGPDDLSLFADPRYEPELRRSRAGALVTRGPVDGVAVPLIVHPDPFVALAELVEIFFPASRPPAGIHTLAFVSPSATIDAGASILPFAHVGERVSVGARTVIHPGVFLGDDVCIGEDCVLWPNVVVREGCRLGDRILVHPGAVIGADGFGFARREGKFVKIRHVGTVLVEDDVEIGANATIDRGTLGSTRIRRGVKLDNLVHIAHNVDVGEDSAMAAQVGISGSTVIGRNVLMGGQSGAVDHLTIGDGAILVVQSGAIGDIAPGEMVTGFPARPHREFLRATAELRHLKGLRRKVRELEEQIEALKKAKDGP